MGGHLVALAALFVEPEPPALALPKVVLGPHCSDSADPRKGVDHHSDQRTVAAKRTEGELREDLGELVMTATISRRVAHEYAAQAGLPAIVADPNSTAAHEYRALVEEVFERANK